MATVNNAHYQFVKGQNPKGVDEWKFQIGTEDVKFAKMDYEQAQANAKSIASEMMVSTVILLPY